MEHDAHRIEYTTTQSLFRAIPQPTTHRGLRATPQLGSKRQGNTTRGQPFPGGPTIGITITSRTDLRLRTGQRQTVLEIRYSGDFDGPGRITITQVPGKGLVVRDQWLGVKNHSMLPSRGAELGHPLVANMGFRGIGRSTQ